MKRNLLKTIMAVILVIVSCLNNIQLMTCQSISASVYEASAVAAQEIDLGDYQSQMMVGEKQLLSVTILPMDATDQTLKFSSSDMSVAKINGMGRISALNAGVTEIAVTCGNVTEKFELTVTEMEVTDIDLGDCPKELEVGSSQLLAVTVIPEDAVLAKITYQSSNNEIASVNEIGRITGISVGTATITIQCGKVKRDVAINVVEQKSDEIPVTDLEIADHANELEVDKTLSLSVTILPSDATDNNVYYESSDETIATVNSSGEVKGISKGNVTITISAGNITKKVDLTVKVAATEIKLDSVYLVMSPGEIHQIIAQVVPEDASQNITYKAIDTEIASVSSSGLITANKCGSGTIIIQSEDISKAITVIVDEEAKTKEAAGASTNGTVPIEYANEISVEDYPVITSEMLKYYYENDENIIIYGNGYTIKLNGGEIKNWENEFYTGIHLMKDEKGTSFELNQNKSICGPITLHFNENEFSGKYVYLYNLSKNKYELLKEQDIYVLELDTPGKYLITEEKLRNKTFNMIILLTMTVTTLACLIAYVVAKKRYWFW